MKKLSSKRIVCFAMALLLMMAQLSLTISASSEETTSVLEDVHINAAPRDESIAIIDSESSLLPVTPRSLPSSVDLSDSAYFPPIGNQRNIGNCTSWAAVYYQFGYQVASKYSLNVSLLS